MSLLTELARLLFSAMGVPGSKQVLSIDATGTLPKWTDQSVITKIRGVLGTITTSIVLAADAILVVPLEANSTYHVSVNLIVTNSGTGGLRWGLLGPTGAMAFNAALATAGIAIDGAGAQLTTSATNNVTSQAAFIVTTGPTAGNLTLLWAQNTSNGITTLTAPSHLVVTKA